LATCSLKIRESDLRAKIFCFFVLAVVAVAIPNVQGQPLSVTSPQRPPWEEFYVLGNQVAEVWVNVTSSYAPANVTLYYLAWPEETEPPQDQDALGKYASAGMHLWSGNQTFATFFVTMPRVANNSYVWGFARAYDAMGSHAESALSRIYYYTIPNPESSNLSLYFSVRHIDPRNLRMDLRVNAWLINAATYLPEILDFQHQPVTLFVSDRYSAYSYTSGEKNAQLYYNSGLPQLFPFDHYEYTFDLLIPAYLNQTGVTISSLSHGRISLGPGSSPYAELVGQQPETQDEAVDNSQWDIKSVMQYQPSQNFTARPPFLRVTITLDRNHELVRYLLLIPTFSLYALLGFSVLLQGKDQLQNRLLLYITIFGFSYTLQPTIKTIAPIIFGFSMIDRVTIALIPCTVILSACSIISTIWNQAGPHNDSVSRWDMFGVVVAALALYLITLIPVTLLGYYQKTFTLFDTGPYGWAILIALFLGLLIQRPTNYFRARYPLMSWRLREFSVELHRRMGVHRRRSEKSVRTTTEARSGQQSVSTPVSTATKPSTGLRHSQGSGNGKRRSRNKRRRTRHRR